MAITPQEAGTLSDQDTQLLTCCIKVLDSLIRDRYIPLPDGVKRGVRVTLPELMMRVKRLGESEGVADSSFTPRICYELTRIYMRAGWDVVYSIGNGGNFQFAERVAETK